MKKKWMMIIIFFWSMLFPSLSLNSFSTEFTDKTISYDDIFSPTTRQELLQHADFCFWLFQK